MAKWSEGFVQANDLNIHYHRTGGLEKPAILLLHGITDNGLCWTPVARALQKAFDVYMLDARGHGCTGGELQEFSAELLAEDVAAFIQALGLQRPYVYGHSMGAITAAMLAAYHAEIVRAIVLEDPPFLGAPLTEERDGKLAQAKLQAFQEMLHLRTLSPAKRLAIVKTAHPAWDESELAPLTEAMVEFNLEVLHHFHVNFPWRETLTRIVCPMLLVVGDPEAGAIITPEITQEASHLWHHGEFVHIRGAGHCIHRDRYAETMAAVQAFFCRPEDALHHE